MSLGYELLKSWKNRKGTVNSMEEIYNWIADKNISANVRVVRRDFPESGGVWFLDKDTGFVRHQNNSFFEIIGYQLMEGEETVVEQPLINQEEIGYLGIICKKINGAINMLMQAKIEPGNINGVQISPTLQATKSNFTKKHRGEVPAYLEYFLKAGKYTLLVDQIQSEQSSRFYKKRNRNIIIFVEDEVEVLPSHMWMTLGQIKELLKEDNLVNMDTRTVLSGLPFSRDLITEEEIFKAKSYFSDESLFNSIYEKSKSTKLTDIYHIINDYKMFSEVKGKIIPLTSLQEWNCKRDEIVCNKTYGFKVIYCDVTIEGREVKEWEQPMVEATGMAIFGLFTTVIGNTRKYLISIKKELGCFDYVEMGASVQLESTYKVEELNSVESLFLEKYRRNEGVVTDVILSEEGGRFYHDQNYNVIIHLCEDEIEELPEGYFWVSFAMLNDMIQFNNILNIQLRNLIALIDI